MGAHLKGFSDVSWSITGLIIFFILFVLLIISTYLPSQVKKYKYLSSLPLELHPSEQENQNEQ